MLIILVHSESSFLKKRRKLPLQFFPSPVKPDGQEPQVIAELLFSVQGTLG